MSPVEELEELEDNCNTNSVGEPEDRIFFHLFGSKSIQKVLSSEKLREAICESCNVPKEYKNSASKTIDCLKSSTKSFGSNWSIYDYKNYGYYWRFDKIGFIKTASLANTEIIYYSKILQGTSSDLRRKSEGLVAAKGSSAARIDASHKKIKVAPVKELAKFPDFSLYFIAVLSSEKVREAIRESSDVPKEYRNCAFKTVDCLKNSTKSCYWRFDKIGFTKTVSLANTEIIHYSKIRQGTSSDLRRKTERIVAAKSSSPARIDASHKMLSSEKLREAICESCNVPKEYKNSASKTIDYLKSSTKSFGSNWSIYDYKNYGPPRDIIQFQLAERKSSPLVLPPFDRRQLSSKSSNWSAGDIIDI
ncbi:hypothetical protein HZH68_017097 [Vespula germanica]|uniref:Nop domain-containing protein n=1 Tax=Vespula germanica TaxID=30212 RepID=A0A834IZU3_VESGE|nr:hypothetical protein HZH68_017097 [Vespula germanica]